MSCKVLQAYAEACKLLNIEMSFAGIIAFKEIIKVHKKKELN
ncbi:hypothetical protein [Metaclostridioides mangenotii]|nr:hypothetical protein [Clostridioides mangenotii]